MRRLVLAVAALAWCGASLASQGISGPAPDFARPDPDGKTLRLSDYRGKVVLLNFWATWCGPCLEEIPAFDRWQRQLGPDGLQVLGVSMDDAAADVQRFLRRTPLGYPVVIGDTQLAKQYGGVLGLPLTYLIDAHGAIVGRYQGATDLAALEARIRKLLAP